MGPTCTICAHPKRQEFDSRIVAESAKSLAAELGLSLAACYRHIRSEHHIAKPPQGANVALGAANGQRQGMSIAPSMSATLRAVQGLAREAQRHLRDARKGSDYKATNGAITAASKALELVAKLRGELQHGANVNVTVNSEQRFAIDSHDAAQGLSAYEVTENAKAWLAAQLEAGDRDAMRTVLELVRMVPSADASTENQSLTPIPQAEPETGVR